MYSWDGEEGELAFASFPQPPTTPAPRHGNQDARPRFLHSRPTMEA